MSSKNVIWSIPVYNDWDSLSVLIREIEKESIKNNKYSVSLVVINDDSTEVQWNKVVSDKIKI